MDDLINRQAAINMLFDGFDYVDNESFGYMLAKLKTLPSAQPTLYGYKIEHLAYIATVMKKEGVTAEYAVRTFDDMSRAIKMIFEETQQKVDEALGLILHDEKGKE